MHIVKKQVGGGQPRSSVVSSLKGRQSAAPTSTTAGRVSRQSSVVRQEELGVRRTVGSEREARGSWTCIVHRASRLLSPLRTMILPSRLVGRPDSHPTRISSALDLHHVLRTN